jgi:hypothetical protein
VSVLAGRGILEADTTTVGSFVVSLSWALAQFPDVIDRTTRVIERDLYIMVVLSERVNGCS